MIKLVDTFNGRIVSRHRTLTAAAKAALAYDRAVKRTCGRDSYIPLKPYDEADERDLSDEDEWIQALNQRSI